MSERQQKNSVINQVCSTPEEESDADVIEITKKERKKVKETVEEIPPATDKYKKQVSQKQLDSMQKAREARATNLKKAKEATEEGKRIIERAYHKEIEADLIKSTLPKYSAKIKKEILQRLKEQKLQELKKQYGYKSESESDSSSEEEEVVVRRKKDKTPAERVRQVKETKPEPKRGILDRYKDFGF